ncbi:hypothetical protein [Actinomadura rifamycini]|uniref:hypothetical protein n=1 Tax=Actinomadura rifamycini TaxID=31962 RepID=UPI0003F6EE57|nr:hypothetical protein [Actinomadura rifamycini]
MSDLGRVLRLDARRTALLVAVPLLTAVGTAAAALSMCPPHAYRDNTVVALVNAVRLLGPVAAALAAWTAVRERPMDYLRNLTARSPATGVLFDLLLLSAAALVSYGAVTAVIVAVTLLHDGTGRSHPLGFAAGAGALVLHVVAGYLAGRVAPHRATAPLVLAATGLWAALRVPGMSWWSLLPPAALNQVALFTTLRPQVLADQVVWAVGATAALILGYVLWATRRALVGVPLAVALAASAAATLGLHGTAGGTVAPARTDQVCREWPLTVCVHPALREALPALTSAVLPLAARLEGTPGAFTRVEQRPGWEPGGVRDGVAGVHLDAALPPGFEERAVRRIRDGLRDARTCPAPRGYGALVDAWLVGEAPPAIGDERTARLFGSWSEDRRRAWLGRHFADYRTCTLGPHDFRTAADVRAAHAPGLDDRAGAAGRPGTATRRSPHEAGNGAQGSPARPRRDPQPGAAAQEP